MSTEVDTIPATEAAADVPNDRKGQVVTTASASENGGQIAGGQQQPLPKRKNKKRSGRKKEVGDPTETSSSSASPSPTPSVASADGEKESDKTKGSSQDVNSALTKTLNDVVKEMRVAGDESPPSDVSAPSDVSVSRAKSKSKSANAFSQPQQQKQKQKREKHNAGKKKGKGEESTPENQKTVGDASNKTKPSTAATALPAVVSSKKNGIVSAAAPDSESSSTDSSKTSSTTTTTNTNTTSSSAAAPRGGSGQGRGAPPTSVTTSKTATSASSSTTTTTKPTTSKASSSSSSSSQQPPKTSQPSTTRATSQRAPAVYAAKPKPAGTSTTTSTASIPASLSSNGRQAAIPSSQQQQQQSKQTVSAGRPMSTEEKIQRHLASLSLSGTNAVVAYVPIPPTLNDWTKNHVGDLNGILADVKEKSGVMSIVVDRESSPTGQHEQKQLIITAMNNDAAHKARVLLEIHLKNQESLSRTERRLQQVQEDFTAVQGAVAAGLRIEFNVSPELTGIVIGKKGERIKKVYEMTGVTKIDVQDGLVRIVGLTNGSVLKAREMLELFQEETELPPDVAQWLSRPMLQDIREKSDCATIRPEGGNIRLIGTRRQVENAKLLLETQVEYITKHRELRASEDQMRRRLYDMGSNYPGGNTGGRGGGGEYRGPRGNNNRPSHQRSQSYNNNMTAKEGSGHNEGEDGQEEEQEKGDYQQKDRRPREREGRGEYKGEGEGFRGKNNNGSGRRRPMPSSGGSEEGEGGVRWGKREGRGGYRQDRDREGQPPRRGLTLREAALLGSDD